eukprot:jgi/Tetstr1/465052/TSEL_009780.t1
MSTHRRTSAAASGAPSGGAPSSGSRGKRVAPVVPDKSAFSTIAKKAKTFQRELENAIEKSQRESAEYRKRAEDAELEIVELTRVVEKLQREKMSSQQLFQNCQSDLKQAQDQVARFEKIMSSFVNMGDGFMKMIEVATGRAAVEADECSLCTFGAMELAIKHGHSVRVYKCPCGWANRVCSGCEEGQWRNNAYRCMGQGCPRTMKHACRRRRNNENNENNGDNSSSPIIILDSEEYLPQSPDPSSPAYSPDSPAYEAPPLAPPAYEPDSPRYSPTTPAYTMDSPPYSPAPAPPANDPNPPTM